jgi:hypothetical protein
MSQPSLKEDLELIAALAAGTAGFINNNVNKMMVGDSKFVKSEVQPKEVVEKAKVGLVKEYAPLLQAQQVQNSQPFREQNNIPSIPIQLPLIPPPVQLPPPQQQISQPVEDKQLTFNFDNSPTAQNIYYKLVVIMEKLDSLNVKVHALSEQVNKKKVRKTEEKE